jgi:F0F1-type ATP synthase assembly protein I
VRDGNLALYQMRVASFVVGFIASLCSFIICLIFVLVQWAAQMAPPFIIEYFYTSLTGVSTLNTAISCAALVESIEARLLGTSRFMY